MKTFKPKTGYPKFAVEFGPGYVTRTQRRRIAGLAKRRRAKLERRRTRAIRDLQLLQVRQARKEEAS